MKSSRARARLLITIPSVGYYIALLQVSEIGDVSQFPDAEKLCSYAGLVLSARTKTSMLFGFHPFLGSHRVQ